MFTITAHNISSKQEAEKACIELLRKGYQVSLVKENGKKEKEADAGKATAPAAVQPVKKTKKNKKAKATTHYPLGQLYDPDKHSFDVANEIKQDEATEVTEGI